MKMDDYYENIETFLKSFEKKLFVYPTLGGRIEWVVSDTNILGIENNYIRCGWNTSRREVLTSRREVLSSRREVLSSRREVLSSRREVLSSRRGEKDFFLSDEELRTSQKLSPRNQGVYKFIPPRECTTENFIKALKKLDTITLCGVLIVRVDKTQVPKGGESQVFFFHSYNAYQASGAVREWFKDILQNNPNITLEQLHNLVEQNKGDDSSQILLTRIWLELLQNCPRDCETDEEIIHHIKKQIPKNPKFPFF